MICFDFVLQTYLYVSRPEAVKAVSSTSQDIKYFSKVSRLLFLRLFHRYTLFHEEFTIAPNQDKMFYLASKQIIKSTKLRVLTFCFFMCLHMQVKFSFALLNDYFLSSIATYRLHYSICRDTESAHIQFINSQTHRKEIIQR